jgi:hypothetical protein
VPLADPRVRWGGLAADGGANAPPVALHPDSTTRAPRIKAAHQRCPRSYAEPQSGGRIPTSVAAVTRPSIPQLLASTTPVIIGPSLADLWHDEHGVLVRQADPDLLLAEARDAIGRHDGDGGGPGSRMIRAAVSASGDLEGRV